MSRPRGRPFQGDGVTQNDVLEAALILLDEVGAQGLTMRALASRLDVTPMSLYHHVDDRAGLLRALADRVYVEVYARANEQAGYRAETRAILTRYHDVVWRYPQLTLALLAEPKAFAGMSRQISERLTSLLAEITPENVLWRDILVDHAHGSALALASTGGDLKQAELMREQYLKALELLLKM